MVSTAASQQEGHGFDPRLGLDLSVWSVCVGSLLALRPPPTKTSRLTGDSKSPVGVKVSVSGY